MTQQAYDPETVLEEPEHIVLSAVESTRDFRLQEQEEPTFVYRRQIPLEPVATVRLKRPLIPARMIPMLLTLSCIFFLLASSILAFTFMGHAHTSFAMPVVTASPNIVHINDTFTLNGHGFGGNDLMTFTRDENISILDSNQHDLQVHADSTGTFSIHIQAPEDWNAGVHAIHTTDEAQPQSVTTMITIQPPAVTPAHLQLATSHLSFSEEVGGITSNKTLTLKNSGGEKVIWQASSEQKWLSVSPAKGTFVSQQIIRVIVNRSGLEPQDYAGQIKFSQQGSEKTPLVLTVSMGVKDAPAVLNISPTSLGYTANLGQNPESQTVILQNSGGQTLNWSSTVTTDDGASWLAISPEEGRLDPNTSAIITISIQAKQLATGSYLGSINFTGGAGGQVGVALDVIAPGNMGVSASALTFSATSGQQAAEQTVKLQNSGGQALGWNVSATVQAQGKWLHATQENGTLNPGATANVVISVDSTNLEAGTYQGTLSFNAGGTTKQVSVKLTITEPSQPEITVQPGSLTFETQQGKNPAAQSFTIKNMGNAPLQWSITKSGSGAATTSVSASQGSLEAGKSMMITVNMEVAQENSGELTTTLTIAEKDGKIASQSVNITTTITEQPGSTATATEPSSPS